LARWRLSGIDAASVLGADAPVLPLAPLVVLWSVCVLAFVIPSLATPPLALGALLIQQLAFLAPFIAFSLASLLVVRATSAEERTLWRGLAAGAVLVTVSEMIVSTWLLAEGPESWGTAASAISVAASLVLIGTLASLSDIRTFSTAARLRHLLDLAGGSTIVGGAVFWAVASWLQRQPVASDGVAALAVPQALAAAAYSSLGAIMLTLVAFNFARGRWGSWPKWERRVVIGIGVYALATMAWPIWLGGAFIVPQLHWDVVVEVAWMTGMSLGFSGALLRLRAGAASPGFVAIPRMRSGRPMMLAALAPVLFVLGILAFGTLMVNKEFGLPDRTAFGVVTAVLTAVTVARLVVSTTETEVLLSNSLVDPVSGIPGHRYFHERLQLEIDLALRHRESLAVVIFDVDDFRTMNETHGHVLGDSVLRLVAEALAGSLTTRDTVCRLGGDQFGAMLVGVDAQAAPLAAERIRRSLCGLRWPDESPLTASVGVALYPVHGTERSELVRAAERACLWAKCRGKDLAVVYEPATVEALPCEDRLSALRGREDLTTVRALAAAVDGREPLSRFHSQRVATLARLVGEELGLDAARVEFLEIAASLHDVGKVGIPDGVLRKTGVLGAEESRRVRQHAVLGERIASFTGAEEILPWIRHHHERWDGTGYPDGIAGVAIPLEARIIAVCDAFDVMTAGTPGSVALSLSSALQEIDLGMGTQFDPEVAEAFIRIVSARRPLLSTVR